MKSVTDAAGWSRRRSPIRNGASLEPARPVSPKVIDLDALAEFNRGTARAVAANRDPKARIDYAAANAKTEARRRWVARKKEKEA